MWNDFKKECGQMKILLIAYVKGNFGDDLFIKTVINRYPDVEFYINSENEEYFKSFKKYSNINVILEKRDFSKIDIDFYDAFLYVGGSIFIESAGTGIKRLNDFREFVLSCKEKGKKFYYLSSNFGPYETEEYYVAARNLFKECEDICFRDTYSQKLFEDIETVRYAPDLILALDFEKQQVLKDSVGVSMIDITKVKGLENLENEYYEFFKGNLRNFIAQGKEIYLFSFCKFAGEEDSIEKLLKYFSEKEVERIHVVKYDDDIESFLSEYSKMEYMICIKFHAMILSTVFKQKKFVLSYYDKLNKVNEDLKLTRNLFDLKNISADIYLELEKFDLIDDIKQEEYKKQAEKQFEKLDILLKKK